MSQLTINEGHSAGEAGPSDAASRLAVVRRAVAEACSATGRPVSSVTLIAASKTFPAEEVAPVIDAGQVDFGENRVQEARDKWPPLRRDHPGVYLHLIGPLQRNKVRQAVALFDVIHSVDRVELCEAVARECQEQGRRPALFVQVNTGCEPQKSGVLPDDADRFLAACESTYELRVSGLMCVPPQDESPEPHFEILRSLAQRHGLPSLSMGMSGDFALAIKHGATHIRVGSAIFGKRQYPCR